MDTPGGYVARYLFVVFVICSNLLFITFYQVFFYSCYFAFVLLVLCFYLIIVLNIAWCFCGFLVKGIDFVSCSLL